jgi:hypothetical protein
MKMINLILEDKLAKLLQSINIKTDVFTTTHSKQQQNREEGETSNEEIIDTIKQALPEIGKQLIFNKIDMGNFVHIKQDDFNIITKLEKGSGDAIDLILVTVMKKPNFVAKPGTKTVEI